MSWRALASSEEVHAAAWALVHFVWQGSVIAALLWLLLAGVPRAQASLRYGACCFALGLLALTPPATFGFLLVLRPLVAMPGSPVPLGAELGVALEAGQGAYVSLWLIAAWGSAVL
jgi:hypothetical protein